MNAPIKPTNKSSPYFKWLVSLMLSSTIFLFGASNSFFQNQYEFSVSYAHIVPPLLVLTMVSTLVIYLLLIFVRRIEWTEMAVAIVASLGVLFWIEGNFIPWKYGVFDGREMDWSSLYPIAGLELTLWLTVIILAVKYHKAVFARTHLMVGFVVGTQLLSLLYVAVRPQVDPWWIKYGVITEEQFNFSNTQNVIVLVVDTFQSSVFQEITDADQELKVALDGFVYFRRASGIFPYTQPSIPALLTGQPYDNSMPFTSYVENIFITQSLPKIMKDAGYLSEVYPMVPMSVYLDEQVVDNVRTSSRRDKYEYSDIVTLATLVDLTVFRHGFMPIKYMTAHHPGLMLQNHVRKIVPANRAAIRPVYRDIAFIDEMEQGASNTRSVPVFKFYHLNGVHSPLTLNENLGYEAMTESRANHKRQSVASLKIVNRFLSKLKEIGVYDNAMIVITADHGFGPIGIHNPDAGFPIKNPDYYKTDAYMGAALPLLLIKPPNTHGTLTVNDVPTMLTDIPLTVAETIGVSNPFGGLNALEMSDDSGRRRPFYWFDWKWIRSNDYLPPIKEYIIQGDNWLSSSWSLSGRTLEKNKTIESPIIPYDLGEKVTFGQKSIGEVYQELGWSKSYSDYVYSKYKYASLVFPITKVDGDLELEIELEPFLAKGAVNSQRVGISVNKEPLKKFELTEPGVQNIKVVIPKRLVDDNILRIAFELPDAARPIDYDMGKDTRTLAIMLRSVVINKLME